MHIVGTTDDYLEQAIAKSGIERVWYESPLFILEKQDAVKRYQDSKCFMARFYKQVRQDLGVLTDADGTPTGGQWSFDADNRQKIPKGTTLPTELAITCDSQPIKEAMAWAEGVPAEQYGESGCWLPYTHEGAQTFLQEFLRERFATFGPYEDAMHTDGVRLWHSALSPLLNIGLLTPQDVLNQALSYADQHDVPLNSLEGFVRQLIGWREFIRASYECDGGAMRSSNFFNHQRPLSNSYWDGSTGVAPVDHVIHTALQYGYTHHIERLMVMGNFMLLSQINPSEVYRWFMGMYVDAYDWVMVPNVYGMSQFADGGSFATKPYISGANYIKKMSNFKSGEWEDTWTALYWHFINTHDEYFKSNHRLSMMPKLLERMKPETKKIHIKTAKQFLKK
jgi:deoxyribodipyrimidine photolyase-related protein